MFFKVPKESRSCARLAIYHSQEKMKPDADLRDYVSKDEKSIFKLDKPKGMFRIDASMHELLKTKSVSSSLIIEITGEKDGGRQIIKKSVIRPIGLKKTYDFSYTVMPI